MGDREKVIEELTEVHDWIGHLITVGYHGDIPEYRERKKAVADALAMLKEQDALPGTWLLDRPGHYKCSVCGAQWGQAAMMMRHCPECGRKMEI